MYSDTAYAPFGEPYAQTGTTDLSYTGQNQDTASGVYDFPARELGQVSGRWPSPDPAGMAAVNPSDPQTWNRYAYVRNSPLNATDPSGMEMCQVVPTCSGWGGDDAGGPNEDDWFGSPDDAELENFEAQAVLMEWANGEIAFPGPLVDQNGNLLGPACFCGGNLLAELGVLDLSNGPIQFTDTLGPYSVTIKITPLTVPVYQGDGSYYSLMQNDAAAMAILNRTARVANSGKTYVLWYGASALVGATGAAAVDLASGPSESALFGRFSPIDGGFSGYLNSNDFLRIGYGWSGELGQNVFRIGGDALEYFMDNPHIDLWPPSAWF